MSKNIDATKSFFPYLCSIFTMIVIAGNVFALKIVKFSIFATPAGMICFPFTYSLGDVITEIYGYDAAKKVIYIGLINLLAFLLLLKVVIHMPAAPTWHLQKEFSAVFDMSTRLFAGTIVGYISGELINSKILSILKYITKGRIFLRRSITSTIVGVTTDTFFFNLAAFGGIIPLKILLPFTLQQYFIKIGFEIIGSIIASRIIIRLKKSENVDVTDKYSYKWIEKYKKAYEEKFNRENKS